MQRLPGRTALTKLRALARDGRGRRVLGHPATRGGLVAASLAAVLVAPLATTSATTAAPAVTIDGARSISDAVSVSYEKPGHRPPSTTDLHLLAYNDFHGNLEPAGLNIYGRFAG